MDNNNRFMKYIDADKLIAEIERFSATEYGGNTLGDDVAKGALDYVLEELIPSLQQEQPDEQPEYGYLFTEYIHGKKSRWSVGDVLAYYICTSNEEGEDILGKIVNVEFDEEDGWFYTFEDESIWDEQSLVEVGAYKKNYNGK